MCGPGEFLCALILLALLASAESRLPFTENGIPGLPLQSPSTDQDQPPTSTDESSLFSEFISSWFKNQDLQDIEPSFSSTLQVEPDQDQQDVDVVVLQGTSIGSLDPTFNFASTDDGGTSSVGQSVEASDYESSSDASTPIHTLKNVSVTGDLAQESNSTDDLMSFVTTDFALQPEALIPVDAIEISSTSQTIFEVTDSSFAEETKTSSSHESTTNAEITLETEESVLEIASTTETELNYELEAMELATDAMTTTVQSITSTTDVELSFLTTTYFILEPEILIPIDVVQMASTSQETFEFTDSSIAQETKMTSSTQDSSNNAESTLETKDSNLEVASTTANEQSYELEATEFNTEAMITVQTMTSTIEPTETDASSDSEAVSEIRISTTSSNYLDIGPKEVKLPPHAADQLDLRSAATKIPELTTTEKYPDEKMPTLFFVLLAFLFLPVVNTGSRFLQRQALKAFFGCCMEAIISAVSLALILVTFLKDKEGSRYLTTILWSIPGLVWITCTFFSLIMGLVSFCRCAPFQTLLKCSTYSADVALICACVLESKYELFLEIKPLIGFQFSNWGFGIWMVAYIFLNAIVILDQWYLKEFGPRPRRVHPTNVPDPADPEQPCEADAEEEEKAVVDKACSSSQTLKSDLPEVHTFVEGGDRPVVTSCTTIQMEDERPVVMTSTPSQTTIQMEDEGPVVTSTTSHTTIQIENE